MQKQWIKYTKRYAEGGNTPEYKLFILDDSSYYTITEYIDEWIDSLEQEEYAWNGGFRGIDWDYIDSPPDEVVAVEINSTQREIERLQDYLSILTG